MANLLNEIVCVSCSQGINTRGYVIRFDKNDNIVKECLTCNLSLTVAKCELCEDNYNLNELDNGYCSGCAEY